MAETLEQRLRAFGATARRAYHGAGFADEPTIFDEAADALAAMSWQPKASAPRDGSVFRAGRWVDRRFSQFDLFFGKKHHDCMSDNCDSDAHDKRFGYQRNYFRCAIFEEKMDFDVWMPLPAPPLENVTPPSNREPAETLGNLDSVGDSPSAGFEKELSSESEKSAPKRVLMPELRAHTHPVMRDGDDPTDGPSTQQPGVVLDRRYP